jgi:hypothetical protein
MRLCVLNQAGAILLNQNFAEEFQPATAKARKPVW